MTDHIPPVADNAWVDRAVARTATVTDAHLAALDLAEAFTHLRARVEAAPHRVHPGHRRRRRLAVSLALIVALAAGAAFTPPGHALTGMFGKPGMTENDTSEYVDTRAGDFPAVAHRIAVQMTSDGLRYPPGVDANQVQSVVVSQMAGSGALMQVTGIRGRFAIDAMCKWHIAWWTAYTGGDHAGLAAAVTGMRDLGTMKIFAQINDATREAQVLGYAERGDAAGFRSRTWECLGLVGP